MLCELPQQSDSPFLLGLKGRLSIKKGSTENAAKMANVRSVASSVKDGFFVISVSENKEK